MSDFFGAVEVLDRSGSALHRVRIERLPFRVGRALDNDLVLDDEYVSPHHGEVRDVQGLVLVDLNSTNGCFVGSERVAQVELIGRTEFRLGHTQLRFRSVAESLAPTLRDPIASSPVLALNALRWALPAMGLAAAWSALDVWLASNNPVSALQVVGGTVPALLVVAIWSLAWSLVNRVVTHRFNYPGHLCVAALGVLAGSLSDSVLGVLSFAFSIDATANDVSILIGALIVAAVIFGHLRLISRGSSQRLWVPSAAMGIAFLAITQLPDSGENDFAAEPELALSLRSPSWALGSARPIEEFYSEAGTLLDKVDEAATED
jgi:pSer/pThr/pTyr-binding forkhead associated (FHA) protein